MSFREQLTMIGHTLGHFEILEKLGEGGMGVVYKARDTHLDRLVAIKILPAEKVADPDRRRRFAQEAKTASALNHPGIVTIHDITQQDGIDFIAMEFVPGRTLDRMSSDGFPHRRSDVGGELSVTHDRSRRGERGVSSRGVTPEMDHS